MRTFLSKAIALLAFCCFFDLVSAPTAAAQTKYWVLLKDKNGVTFNPEAYFDAKALTRRRQLGLPAADEKDKPLNQDYLAQVTRLTDSVTASSRWFNAVACFATPAQVNALQRLAFVVSVVPMPTQPLVLAQTAADDIAELNTKDREILENQTLSLGATAFKAKGLNGKGVRVAVLDAGFKGVDQQEAFAEMRRGKRILKTWDFVKKREYVYDYATHGTMVLSCVGGTLNGQDLGLATGAEFLLARTERMHTERFSEEEYWVQAMEWADKNGADIINSSLGYTNNRYFKEQMDGKTSLVSRAAEIAFEKGMLVVNAAGNDGEGNWKTLGAPADAENVLTVGAIDPDNYLHAGFSSFGPTADKRLKPNVAAFGVVIAAGPKGLTRTQGTSFASPLVAGFAACLWQTDPKKTNREMLDLVQRAGHLYPYYDYAHGYGVPQIPALLAEKATPVPPTLQLITAGDSVFVEMLPELEKNKPAVLDSTAGKALRYPFQEYFYYHITNPGTNVLHKYYVIEPGAGKRLLGFRAKDREPGTTMRFHYKGYTLELFD